MSAAYDYSAEPANDGQADPPALAKLKALIQNPNIAEGLDDATLASMGEKVVAEYDIDVASREEEGYDKKTEEAMNLALQVREEKSYPWPKASNVKFPLLSTAAIQFNARAYPAIIDGFNIVKGKVEGQPTPEKQQRADRIGAHMSYQLLEQMDGWEEDTDRLLIMLPIVGCVHRKSYFDPLCGHNSAVIIAPDKFVVNYWARDLDSCPRATHVLSFYPHEIAEKQRSGMWLDVDLGEAPDSDNDEEAPHEFLEQHRLWDLDDDDYPEPYIITVHRESRKVVRVVARFEAGGVKIGPRGDVAYIEATKTFTKYGFIPAPDGSYYDVGFGQLLGPLADTINGTINQLMDAGHLANVQGGFIGDGVSIKSGNLQFRPGEWKKAGTNGQALAQQIVPLPVKEPSSVLFQLLGMLIEASKDVTATQDILTGDAARATTPVGTTMALIEQGLKTFTAIVKRVHRAFRRELGIYYDLNAKYLNQQEYFTFQDVQGVVAQQDYAVGDCDVVPMSDPSMATDMQRAAKAQFLLQFAGKGVFDDRALVLRVCSDVGVQDVQELLPKQPPMPDPKLLIESKKLDQKDRELDIREGEARAGIALDLSAAQFNMEKAFIASPEGQAALAAFIDQRVQQEISGGGQQVQQPDVPGMAGGAGNAAVPPVPQGPAGPPGGAMGLGPGNGLPPPDQGLAPGGAGQPGME